MWAGWPVPIPKIFTVEIHSYKLTKKSKKIFLLILEMSFIFSNERNVLKHKKTCNVIVILLTYPKATTADLPTFYLATDSTYLHQPWSIYKEHFLTFSSNKKNILDG